MLASEGKEFSCFGGKEGGNHKAVIKLMCSGAIAGVEGSETVTLGFVSIEDTDSVNTIDEKVNVSVGTVSYRIVLMLAGPNVCLMCLQY